MTLFSGSQGSTRRAAVRMPLCVAACGALTLGLLSGCHWLKTVSVDSAGVQANESSFGAVLSADGRYLAFFSTASNLVTGDTNATSDVFLHDTQTASTTRVSVNSAGTQTDTLRSSVDPALSADGRFVAFLSQATNLVADDTNGVRDIFVRDTLANTTTRVSVTNAGGEADSDSYEPAISADGRYVAFSSNATNLVTGDTNGVRDVFVRDKQFGGTVRVSLASAGDEGNNGSYAPAISADGRYVAFSSDATNLVAGDANGARDVFLHDTQTGATIRVSVNSAGGEAGFFVPGFIGGDFPALSADGRYVAFMSEANNLVAGDTNLQDDIFLHDTQTGVTTRVSVDSAGRQARSFSETPALSADGRYVAFVSFADNLVSGDTNFAYDVFVHDTQAGTTTRLSTDPLGAEANAISASPALSGDGRYVAFGTDATNLFLNDTNGRRDIIIRAVPQLAATAAVPDHLPIGATTPVTLHGEYFLPGTQPAINGASVSNIVIVDENTITMDVTVKASQAQGARTVYVNQFGTGPGPLSGVSASCENCVTFQ